MVPRLVSAIVLVFFVALFLFCYSSLSSLSSVCLHLVSTTATRLASPFCLLCFTSLFVFPLDFTLTIFCSFVYVSRVVFPPCWCFSVRNSLFFWCLLFCFFLVSLLFFRLFGDVCCLSRFLCSSRLLLFSCCLGFSLGRVCVFPFVAWCGNPYVPALFSCVSRTFVGVFATLPFGGLSAFSLRLFVFLRRVF